MTRTLTLRVPDDQYDWLVDRAIHDHDGELSEAVRSSLDTARVFEELLSNRDPLRALARMLDAGAAEEVREIQEDADNELRSGS
jgi:hypothetical protein